MSKGIFRHFQSRVWDVLSCKIHFKNSTTFKKTVIPHFEDIQEERTVYTGGYFDPAEKKQGALTDEMRVLVS